MTLTQIWSSCLLKVLTAQQASFFRFDQAPSSCIESRIRWRGRHICNFVTSWPSGCHFNRYLLVARAHWGGIISAIHNSYDIQISAQISEGSSGAPILNYNVCTLSLLFFTRLFGRTGGGGQQRDVQVRMLFRNMKTEEMTTAQMTNEKGRMNDKCQNDEQLARHFFLSLNSI